MVKRCFKCLSEKDISEFYRHPMMADGHLGKCKVCTKADVTSHRRKNLDRVREYDRQRGRSATARDRRRRYGKANPVQVWASRVVKNRQRFKRFRSTATCGECGESENIRLHHDDYMLPFLVRALCATHHRLWHVENGPGANTVPCPMF